MIIPNITESRLDKGGTYLLRYTDVQACFTGKVDVDIYLSVYFEQFRWKAAGQFTIVECAYWGETGPEPYTSAIRIDVGIMAVPHRMIVETRVTLEAVRTLLHDELDRMIEAGLTNHSWWTRLTLLEKTRSLAYHSSVGSLPLYGTERLVR